jgi:hypothetical protein
MSNTLAALIVEFLIWGPIVFLWSNGIIPIELVICALIGMFVGKSVADERWKQRIESRISKYEQSQSNMPVLREYRSNPHQN